MTATARSLSSAMPDEKALIAHGLRRRERREQVAAGMQHLTVDFREALEPGVQTRYRFPRKILSLLQRGDRNRGQRLKAKGGGTMRRFLFVGLIALQAWCAQPEFEVASIKPNTSADMNGGFRFNSGSGLFIGENIPLRFLIASAFQVRDYQLSGVPGWVNQVKYDIQARGPGNPGEEQIAAMLRSLLKGRFHFEYHKVTKEGPIYVLMPAKGGIKLQESKEGPCALPAADKAEPDKPATVECDTFNTRRSQVDAKRITMPKFVIALSSTLDRPVIDGTGYTKTFDAHLEWTPTEVATDPNGEPGPSVFTAIQEQLGLRLEAQKGPVETLVIDRIERPTDN